MLESRWNWRTVEHTADLAIEVEAVDIEDLFVAAASAIAGVTRGLEEGSAEGEPRAVSEWRDLVLEAQDQETLLVEWLRELLYLLVTEELIFAAAEIEELGETRLAARAGFALVAEPSRVERELKGVTYHDLTVRRQGGSWLARVVFDL